MLLYTENQLKINETNKQTNKLKYLSYISEILTVLMEDYKLILKWSDSFRYEPKSMYGQQNQKWTNRTLQTKMFPHKKAVNQETRIQLTV